MKAFTLLDTLIALVIFTFVIAAMYGVITTANISYNTDTTLMYLGQQARQVMFWLTKDMREASSVSITYIDDDSDLIVFDTIDEPGIQYYLDGNQVVKEYPLNTKRVIGNNIARFKFSRAGKEIEVDLMADRELSSQTTLSFPLREKLRLRN
jgi:type II secretory pathway component PulJ